MCPRRSRAGLELRGLFLEGRAAEEDDGPESQDPGRLRETLGLASYLDGQLLRGRRDDHSRLAGAPALEDRDELEGRGEVGEGLARAGLGLDESVARERMRG